MQGTQTYGHGKPPTWGKLGGSRRTFALDLSSFAGLIFGKPNVGKTYLITTCEEGFHMNLDLSSITNPNAKCVSWPEIDPATGTPLHEGKPRKLDAEWILETATELIRMAQADEPRPRVIFLDTLPTLQRYFQSYVTRNAKALNLWSSNDPPPTSFKQLFAKSAYAVVYDMIIDLVDSLKAAGYGVFLIAHATQTKVPIGENATIEEWSFTMGPGMWARLHPILELSIAMDRVVRQEHEKINEPLKTAKGVINRVRTVTRDVIYYTLDARPESPFPGMVKSRVPYAMVVSSADGWREFSEGYKQASINQLEGKPMPPFRFASSADRRAEPGPDAIRAPEVPAEEEAPKS